MSVQTLNKCKKRIKSSVTWCNTNHLKLNMTKFSLIGHSNPDSCSLTTWIWSNQFPRWVGVKFWAKFALKLSWDVVLVEMNAKSRWPLDLWSVTNILWSVQPWIRVATPSKYAIWHSQARGRASDPKIKCCQPSEEGFARVAACKCACINTYSLQLQFQSPRLLLCFAQLGLNRTTAQKEEKVTGRRVQKKMTSCPRPGVWCMEQYAWARSRRGGIRQMTLCKHAPPSPRCGSASSAARPLPPGAACWVGESTPWAPARYRRTPVWRAFHHAPATNVHPIKQRH